MKVLVFPLNSLILSDLVLRRGHEPLTSMDVIAERVEDKPLKSPPYNVEDSDLVKALRYTPVDLPAGAKGRIALFAKLVEEADAALIMDSEACFGPSGCFRANMALQALIRRRGLPTLRVEEPSDPVKAEKLLKVVDEFLGEPKPLGGLVRGSSTPKVLRITSHPKVSTYPTEVPRIALLSCGLEYSGVYGEVVDAIRSVGAEVYIPEYSKEKVGEIESVFGFKPVSGDLRLLMAQALSLLELKINVRGALVMTCFRCGEGSLVRHVVRSFIAERLKIPVVAYSFTERTRAYNMQLRVEALYNLAVRRRLYKIPVKGGLALGVDSGSTSTKAVVIDGREVLGFSWRPTVDVERDAEIAAREALEMAGVNLSQLDAVGVTGYGRLRISDLFEDSFKVDDVNSSAFGALLLSGERSCLILDIGGTDSKAVSIRDLTPTSFTVGGTCAGASGRFLESAASRLGVTVEELGEMAVEGLSSNVTLNAYCAIFGMQDVVALLARGLDRRSVAAAVCRSIAEQFYQQFLGDIDVVSPLIHVGGTSLVEGLTRALEEVTGIKALKPKHSHLAGAIGAAAMALNSR